MNFLIDTNIIIYRLKNMGNVNENFLNHRNDRISVSVVSYGEMVFGAKNWKTVRRYGFADCCHGNIKRFDSCNAQHQAF